MKEVGDKFGAGELILPFVLQSAEVMKKAVAQLEKYLDKLEGYTKGTVVLATVFGDVHDIGKSLVNTILTNNGYSVVDLGKQVPIGTILDAAQEHDATAIGLSALLVSTSKQMPLAVQELHERGLQYPVLVGGAAINRDFGRRILYPKGQESDEVYDPGVFYCKDAFAGLAVMDQLVEPEKRTALVDKFRDEARKLREKGPEPELGPTDDESVRSAARTDVPIPTPPFWGVQEIPVDLDEVFPHLDTHVLFKLHWGGRGKKGEEWRQLVDEEFQPRLERMWREQDYLAPARAARLLPLQRGRQLARALRPRGPREGAREARLPAPARPRPHLPDRLLPAQGERRARRGRHPGRHRRPAGDRADGRRSSSAASSPSSSTPTGSACRPPRAWPSGSTRACARTSASRPTRAAAGRGATRPARTSPSTSRSSACSAPRRSASRCRAATRSSPSSRRWRSSPTTRRPSTSA